MQHCSRDSHKPTQSSPSPRVRDTTNRREQIVLVPLAVCLDCLALPCLPILLLPCWMWSPERLLLLAVKSCRRRRRRNGDDDLLSTSHLWLCGGGLAAVLLWTLWIIYTRLTLGYSCRAYVDTWLCTVCRQETRLYSPWASLHWEISDSSFSNKEHGHEVIDRSSEMDL